MDRFIFRLLGSPFAKPALESAIPFDFDRRMARFTPVLYIFFAIPVAVIIILAIRRLYIKTIVEKRTRSITQDLRAEAEEYIRKGEYVSAALIYDQKFNDYARAAPLYEQGGDYLQAASLFESVGERERACELYEWGGNYGAAAEISESLGRNEEAAALYGKCGRHLDAANCLEKAGRALPAARSCREGGNYRRSAELLYGIQMYREAAEMFEICLKQKELASNLEDFYTFSLMLEKAGDAEKASDILRKISAADSSFKDVSQRLSFLKSKGKPAEAPAQVEKAPVLPEGKRTLREVLAGEGRLEPKEALKLWVSALRALKDFHARSGPHEKLSSECFIDTGGHLELEKGDSGKTPYFEDGGGMASDIYAMGVVLYEMLAGTVEGIPSVKPSQRNPEVPAIMDALVQKCLMPRPERFASIDEIFSALKTASKKKE